VPNKTLDILNEFYEKEYKKILQELIEEIKEEIEKKDYKILKN
jgi:anti-sigma28 factor (negative regulator of flagellin synthesis)